MSDIRPESPAAERKYWDEMMEKRANAGAGSIIRMTRAELVALIDERIEAAARIPIAPRPMTEVDQ